MTKTSRFMGLYLQHKEFYNQPVRLNKEQMAKPLAVVRSFCEAYHLHEIRQHLSDFLEMAITTENPAFAEAEARNAAFLFYQQLEELLEAVYLINSKKNQAGSRPGGS